MPLYVRMNLDKYRCSSRYNKKVTHGLVKGNWVDGYKGLPLCSKYAKKLTTLLLVIGIQSQL